MERQREKSERLRARLGIESLFGNRVHFWYKFREMARFSTQDEPVRVINMCHVHLGVFISEKFIMLQLCCWSRSSGSAKSLSGSAPASESNAWSSFASFRRAKLGRPRSDHLMPRGLPLYRPFLLHAYYQTCFILGVRYGSVNVGGRKSGSVAGSPPCRARTQGYFAHKKQHPSRTLL